MSAEDTIDELVDKAIDEALDRVGKDSEDIKKRKPKPFRYLTDKEEIQTELKQEETTTSMMRESSAANIFKDKLAIMGLGDVDTIENVIKKHEASRKFKEK